VVLPLRSAVVNLPSAQVQPRVNAGCVSHLPPFHILIGDVLDIRPWRNRALNEAVTVGPDGRIPPAIVPDQVAHGIIAPELHAVRCSAFGPTRIHAGGRVNNPRVHHQRARFDSLLGHRAGGRAKVMTGRENNARRIRRWPNNVPEHRSALYNDKMWGANPPTNVRLCCTTLLIWGILAPVGSTAGVTHTSGKVLR